jgi:hypothetical protein
MRANRTIATKQYRCLQGIVGWLKIGKNKPLSHHRTLPDFNVCALQDSVISKSEIITNCTAVWKRKSW